MITYLLINQDDGKEHTFNLDVLDTTSDTETIELIISLEIFDERMLFESCATEWT